MPLEAEFNADTHDGWQLIVTVRASFRIYDAVRAAGPYLGMSAIKFDDEDVQRHQLKDDDVQKIKKIKMIMDEKKVAECITKHIIPLIENEVQGFVGQHTNADINWEFVRQGPILQPEDYKEEDAPMSPMDGGTAMRTATQLNQKKKALEGIIQKEYENRGMRLKHMILNVDYADPEMRKLNMQLARQRVQLRHDQDMMKTKQNIAMSEIQIRREMGDIVSNAMGKPTGEAGVLTVQALTAKLPGTTDPGGGAGGRIGINRTETHHHQHLYQDGADRSKNVHHDFGPNFYSPPPQAPPPVPPRPTNFHNDNPPAAPPDNNNAAALGSSS